MVDPLAEGSGARLRVHLAPRFSRPAGSTPSWKGRIGNRQRHGARQASRPAWGTNSRLIGATLCLVADRAPESFTWPLVALVLVIVPQLAVPARDRIGPPLFVPLVEMAVFLVIAGIAARPGPVPRRSRPLILVLCAVLVGANAAAAVRLVALVLDSGKVGGHQLTATRLLVAGAMVVLTNIITFGLLYWELDGGGPAGRIADPPPEADFEFPQMTDPGPRARPWHAQFPDHLYLAYTNVLAFSPTDAMPLTHRAKGLMTLQSLISIAVLTVVLARVINILPT